MNFHLQKFSKLGRGGELVIMANKKELRSTAEKRLREKTEKLGNIPKDVDALIHELQVHQVELEMQNEELRESRKELEELHEKYYDLYNSAPVGYFTLDATSAVTELNSTGAELLGFDKNDLIKTLFRWYITPNYSETFLNYLKQAIQTGAKQVFDVGLIRKNGIIFYAHVEMMPQFNPETTFKMAVVDITQRKKLEDDLKRSNNELQQFAYVASHDLQEPLRTIASFTQLLARRYEGKLDSDADEFIGYIVDASIRMKQQIEDLLEFSRVMTKGSNFEKINLEQTIKQIISSLGVLIKENDAEITYNPLPEIYADSRQIARLFQNIITNSIKFRKPDEPPKIHISVEKDEKTKEYVFSISDNGIGIDPKYQDRIFTIFQRLHTIEEYQGTGIGLAVARKIVERHGGHIWVESELEKGATFYFTLPIPSQ